VTAGLPRNVTDRRTKFGAGHRPRGLPNITPVADRYKRFETTTKRRPAFDRQSRTAVLAWEAGENPTSPTGDSGLLNLFAFCV
jgi:hypothetical protein